MKKFQVMQYAVVALLLYCSIALTVNSCGGGRDYEDITLPAKLVSKTKIGGRDYEKFSVVISYGDSLVYTGTGENFHVNSEDLFIINIYNNYEKGDTIK